MKISQFIIAFFLILLSDYSFGQDQKIKEKMRERLLSVMLLRDSESLDVLKNEKEQKEKKNEIFKNIKNDRGDGTKKNKQIFVGLKVGAFSLNENRKNGELLGLLMGLRKKKFQMESVFEQRLVDRERNVFFSLMAGKIFVIDWGTLEGGVWGGIGRGKFSHFLEHGVSSAFYPKFGISLEKKIKNNLGLKLTYDIFPLSIKFNQMARVISFTLVLSFSKNTKTHLW